MKCAHLKRINFKHKPPRIIIFVLVSEYALFVENPADCADRFVERFNLSLNTFYPIQGFKAKYNSPAERNNHSLYLSKLLTSTPPPLSHPLCDIGSIVLEEFSSLSRCTIG